MFPVHMLSLWCLAFSCLSSGATSTPPLFLLALNGSLPLRLATFWTNLPVSTFTSLPSLTPRLPPRLHLCSSRTLCGAAVCFFFDDLPKLLPQLGGSV